MPTDDDDDDDDDDDHDDHDDDGGRVSARPPSIICTPHLLAILSELVQWQDLSD